MRLFLVHCGYYDEDVAEGLFESHANFLIAARTCGEARVAAKLRDDFRKKRMHVDGVQEIEAVGGYRIVLHLDDSLASRDLLRVIRHRDLAPNSIEQPSNPGAME